MAFQLEEPLNIQNLPLDHFLALPRPDANFGPPPGAVDTTTLAAHDFDVDTRSGFMPPQPPLTRLPIQWEEWEQALEDAISGKLQLGDKPDLTSEDVTKAADWRQSVQQMSILPTVDLKRSEIFLRRAHHVLAWIMHFYIRTLPPTKNDIHIPPPITLPLLQVSSHLQLPPVLTYSDDVLYNWALKTPVPMTPLSPAPAIDNLRCLTLFTGTRDEEEFYLSSARIELQGVKALSLMQAVMDEAFVGDEIAVKRITSYLLSLSDIIAELTKTLSAVRDGCDPHVFYNDIRPWFRGADSDQGKWVFDGLELDPELAEPTELSGPSAGQSSMIHALDIFLGVDRYSHASHVTGSHASELGSKQSNAIDVSSISPSGSSSLSSVSSSHMASVPINTPSPSSVTSSRSFPYIAFASLPASTSPPSNSKTTAPQPTPSPEPEIHIPQRLSQSLASSSSTARKASTAFLTRMQTYMPRHHRAFLRHLSSNPRPLRALVESSDEPGIRDAYNAAVSALKVFRDAHVRIVAIYIVGPSRKGGRPENEVNGTGGTNSIQFVKSVRDLTAGAVLTQASA